MYKILLKQFIIIIFIILTIIGIVLGAILPWGKAQAYINTLTDMQSGRTYTAEQFENQVGGVFNFYSPIGQEEVVKFFSSDILGVITQSGFQEPTARFLVNYIDKYLFNNNVRHLIMGGVFNETLWRFSGSEEDYKKSEEYFKKAYTIGPNLPPVLYNLFDLYRLKGDKENTEKIGEEILNYWPDDSNVRKAIEG
ncbi:MAG: hypothetical protein WC461_00480 [Candidatus Paceibacterota bacterium]